MSHPSKDPRQDIQKFLPKLPCVRETFIIRPDDNVLTMYNPFRSGKESPQYYESTYCLREDGPLVLSYILPLRTGVTGDTRKGTSRSREQKEVRVVISPLNINFTSSFFIIL